MKVLQVNNVYRNGSTGKITYDIHVGLKEQGIDSVVCYGRGARVQEKDVYKVCGEFDSYANHAVTYLTGVMYGGCPISTRKLISIIKKEQPDVVHLQCLNGYFVNIYRLIEWLKRSKIKTVLTLHAEFMYTGGCGHALDCNQWMEEPGCTNCPRWKKETKSWFLDGTGIMWRRMKKAFEGFDDDLVVTSVSPWVMERAKQSPILRGKQHRVVLNGLDTQVFHPSNPEEIGQIKQELGIGNERVVFHATPSFNDDPNHIKGGYYVIELAKKMPAVKFVVAGRASEGLQVPENVILLGKVTDQQRLAALYSMGDVTLLTSKKETFSMVTAESLCCGTPVVGFCAGAPEMIALQEYSSFVPYGEMEQLKGAVEEMLTRVTNVDAMVKRAECYSKGTMRDSYVKIYRKILGEQL